MFVKSLKEHDEALQVIAWLKEDVLGIVQGSSQIELSKITNSAQKLGAYAALFNDAAMKAFNQLTQGTISFFRTRSYSSLFFLSMDE